MYKNKIFIVDFNAGNSITHHLEYVKTYAKYLQSFNIEIILVLPKNTQKNEINDKKFSVKRVLRSPKYDFSRKNLMNQRIKRLVTKVLRIKFSREKAERRFLKHNLKAIRKLLNNQSTSLILFPTVDGLSLELVEMILKSDLPIGTIFLRFIDWRFEKDLKEKNYRYFNLLNNLINKYEKRLRLSCETKPLVSYFQKKINSPKEIYWAPLPHIARRLARTEPYTFGFIGGAKQRKGFGDIPVWIRVISKMQPDSKFLVQKSPFIWPKYRKTLNRLEANENVELLSEVVAEEDFFHTLSRCSFICLPYNRKSYSLSGSSIFFYAADMLIPVIAYAGLGFSFELKKYTCGILVKKVLATVDVSDDHRSALILNLLEYNEVRNSKNKIFFQDVV